jgi:hypothetical protein
MLLAIFLGYKEIIHGSITVLAVVRHMHAHSKSQFMTVLFKSPHVKDAGAG